MGLSSFGGWPGVLGRLFAGESLGLEEAAAAVDSVLAGEATPAQVAAFLAALRTKGETVEELTGLVRAIRARAVPLDIPGDLLDTCGTGGDRSGTINVSTISALVAAAAGARVCKHGNRAASSNAGSADILEALGVAVDLGPAGVARCVEEVGIGFCLAQRYHPALRAAAPIRRELGVATVFNFIGPLANPAHANRQLVGVGDPVMAEKMLGVLEANGVLHAMVVYGNDGLDELTTVTTSTVLETVLEGGGATYRRSSYQVDATQLGLPRAELSQLTGGSPEVNAQLAREVLAGSSGPRRDFVVLNAGAALVVAGLAADLAGGVELAGAVLSSGAALAKLDKLVELSQSEAAQDR
ncbi:MAG: anthranilate phosphoribosyltransferase [Acidimicrobiales bacterium]